jgi:predicted RNA binding protein YcfA (HicA-like mRNA interferase family)
VSVKAERAWRLIRLGSYNLSFADLVRLANAFGFVHVRTAGSHRIFNHPNLQGMLSLQPDGHQAKPYQIRQLVKLIEKYGLTLGRDEKDIG